MATKSDDKSTVTTQVKSEGRTLVQNLDEIEKRVAELKDAIKSGQPLTMGRTNFLSGLLSSLRQSMGAW